MVYDDEYYALEKYDQDQHVEIDRISCQNCGYEVFERILTRHMWEDDDNDMPSYYSETQHAYVTNFGCDCGETKSYAVYEDHAWYLDDVMTSYKYKTYDQHEKILLYACDKCESIRYETVVEGHNGKGYCEDCTYPTKDRVLKEGKYTYRSGRPWLEIHVEEKGYITINLRSRTKAQAFSLYNGQKEIFKDSKISDGTRIPVKKGTYYIRIKDGSENYSVKYSFHKPITNDNTSKAKATSLGTERTATRAIYSTDKTSKWARWFKIKVKDRHRINLYLNTYQTSPKLKVYDKNGNPVPIHLVKTMSSVQDKYATDEKLQAGTYYICVKENWSDKAKKRTTGSVFKLEWK